jgi:hypothetical protein
MIPAWRMSWVYGQRDVYHCPETVATPGICACCHEAWHQHKPDAKLEACAALFAQKVAAAAEPGEARPV